MPTDEEKLREIARKVHLLRLAWRGGGKALFNSGGAELMEIEKLLHAISGCPHPTDMLEFGGEDSKGLYVLCSKCAKITRDLRTWKDAEE